MKTLTDLGYTIQGEFKDVGIVAFVKPADFSNAENPFYGKRIEVMRYRYGKPVVSISLAAKACSYAGRNCSADLTYEEFVALRKRLEAWRIRWIMNDFKYAFKEKLKKLYRRIWKKDENKR